MRQYLSRVLIVAVLFAIVLFFACAVRMPDLSLLQSRDGNDVWTDESGLPYFPDPDSARMHMTNRFLSDVCFGTVIIYLIFAVVSSVFLQRSGRFACYLKYLYIFNYLTEVDLGEIDFGKIDYDLRRCHMQDIFRGRKTELRILDKKFKQSGIVMTVLYGHRRIGKTRLINKFMHDHDCKSVSFTAVERGEAELLSMMTESVLNSLSPELLGNISFNSFENLWVKYLKKWQRNILCHMRVQMIFLFLQILQIIRMQS